MSTQFPENFLPLGASHEQDINIKVLNRIFLKKNVLENIDRLASGNSSEASRTLWNDLPFNCLPEIRLLQEYGNSSLNNICNTSSSMLSIDRRLNCFRNVHITMKDPVGEIDE